MLHRIYVLILCALNMQYPGKCRLHPRIHFKEPLPIIIRNGRLLEPTDATGYVNLEHGDQLTLSCENGGVLRHPYAKGQYLTATVTCQGEDVFKNEEWLNAPAQFSLFTCSNPPNYSSKLKDRQCAGRNSVIEVGYTVQDHFYPVYESCFNDAQLRVVYTKYTQKPYNIFFQTKVDRPIFKAGSEYGTVPVEMLFSPIGQKAAVTQVVGNMINNFITKHEFLARGHLAAKTDFVFAFSERATFHYVNCAPQWSGFNGGNWNSLEVDLRQHIYDAGYDATIYTGTSGVTHLISENGRVKDLYLYSDENNNPVIPVPQYFYKVVYDSKSECGVAFVGINNPYHTTIELIEMAFCNDVCRNSDDFSWLTWHPDSPHEGYAFCCTVDDFRQSIQHLPDFPVKCLLK